MKSQIETLKVVANGHLDYVSPGTYKVTRNLRFKKDDYRFENTATGGATYIRPWAFERAKLSGLLTVIA
jgi:hypothetical protein